MWIMLVNFVQIHARLGEVLYMAASAADSNPEKYLAESLRRFCRSIELCDDYLRGYYGLKLVGIRSRKYALRLTNMTRRVTFC